MRWTAAVEPSMSEDMSTKLLEESVGKVVLVKLRGGKSLRGKLQGFDQHMNLLLGEAEDISVVDNSDRLGTIIVRGDNVVIISPPKN
jgi:small nuclear ribonucleoprotein